MARSYITNAIESVNMGLRKVTMNRGSFPNDGGGDKASLPGTQQHCLEVEPLCDWKSSVNRFTISPRAGYRLDERETVYTEGKDTLDRVATTTHQTVNHFKTF